MVAIDLKQLVGHLNDTCRRALEAAIGLTSTRTHYNVEIEHWLVALADRTDGDVSAILKHYEIEPGRFAADLNRSLEKMKTGNGRVPGLAPELADLMKQAWLFASLDQSAGKLRSGHLLWAMLADESLSRHARDASSQLLKIAPDLLKRDFATITANSAEAQEAAAYGASGGEVTEGGAPMPRGGGGALEQFTIDLTAQAKAGKIDPILGRDSEIRQMIDILTRRRQNNPILTGEAGVGKTAVVEGFALRLAAGDVPPMLQNVTLRTLDLGLLQAGAGVRGEFENRLRGVIDEVKASPKPIIMFIDEAHQLIGAGGSQGQGDAANLLKPALARGELRTIAATTWAEYKKYFEKDAALTRRFQVVQILEPTEPLATAMMRGLVATLEKHHHVRILDQAVSESGAAVGALHSVAAVAGQVDEPARHRLCAGGDEPVGNSGPDRGPATAHQPDRHRTRHRRPRNCLRRKARRASRGAGNRARAEGGRTRGLAGTLGAGEGARHGDGGNAGADRRSRQHRRQGLVAREAGDGRAEAARAARRGAADLPGGGWPGDRRSGRGLDRHSDRPDAVERNPHRAEPEGHDGAAHCRSVACVGSGGAGDPHVACRLDRSAQADRCIFDGRHVRHRQDGDRVDAR